MKGGDKPVKTSDGCMFEPMPEMSSVVREDSDLNEEITLLPYWLEMPRSDGLERTLVRSTTLTIDRESNGQTNAQKT